MFPIGDDNSEVFTTPYVNYTLIAINILVFLLLQQAGYNDQFTYAFSLVPREIMTGQDLAGAQVIKDTLTGQVLGKVTLEPTPFSVYITFLSSMFMHGGIMHIFGNMLFLWIFGDNIEHRIGHIRYLVFYLICGFLAAVGQIVMDTNSAIPMLGASGAISGVLGGYILLFPHNRVRAIIFNFLTTVPAFVALGLWIGYQLLASYLGGGEGGVAYAAHIGGFLGGLALIKIFAIGMDPGGTGGRYSPPRH
ncbi:MAG TPA: rhomboid family intramembrane serine protease [Pyrinomonadaceae bacterium]|jgi:membrane associated rhomboid family serine protease|nr:rhomboid family intramembrane serine protease [Pyrinomonadaceae bacterium]